MEKIICPFHKINGQPERTPSCVVYHDHYHCFSCGAHGVDLSSLGNGRSLVSTVSNGETREHLGESLNRIKSLPRGVIRGLHMHANRDSYYVLWPNGDYYKRRDFKDTEARYYCPKGHPKPPFVLNPGKTGCIVVEGEINALSLATVVTDWTIVSPGGASEFNKYLTEYKKYSTIVLIADKDPAGAEAIIKTKPLLLKHTHDVRHYLIDPNKDLNDWLVKDGQEGLSKFTETELGLPPRVRRNS